LVRFGEKYRGGTGRGTFALHGNRSRAESFRPIKPHCVFESLDSEIYSARLADSASSLQARNATLWSGGAIDRLRRVAKNYKELALANDHKSFIILQR
jgi:hypothetical protein